MVEKKVRTTDLGVGGRSWMRLGASSLLLPHRRFSSDGRELGTGTVSSISSFLGD